jgi:hypothetical protein
MAVASASAQATPPEATATPTGGTAGTSSVGDIEPSDIIANASAAQEFSQLGWKWSIECAGQAVGGLNVPTDGLRGSDLGDQWTDLRFARVSASDSPARAFLMRVDQSDPSVRGGQRCEMLASPTQGAALPSRQNFWFAVGLYLPDWVAARDETIVTQFHSSAGSIPLNPFVALSIRGSSFHLSVRHNASATPAKETTVVANYGFEEPLPVNRWVRFVVQARISHSPEDRPFLRLWQDGVLKVNHLGPVGYASVDTQYVKLGLYHWNGEANQWQPEAKTRTALVINPALIRDARERYGEADIRRYIYTTP